MRMEKEIAKIMKSNNFYLARNKNHNIWKNQSGEMIIASNSPSCPYTLLKLKRRVAKLKDR